MASCEDKAVEHIGAVYDLMVAVPELSSLDFWRNVLLFSQTNKGVESSQCIKTYDGFIELYNDMQSKIKDDAAYYAAQLAKGQGEGTNVGKIFADAQAYIDVYIYGVNVFNYCDINYYMRAIGKVFSASGAVNQGMNFVWRALSTSDMDNYYYMSVATCAKDPVKAGQTLGTFISLFLMVETPETTTSTSYSSVNSLM